MNFFAIANGSGLVLLGATFVFMGFWSVRYALGKINPFREVVLAGGVVQFSVGILSACSAVPILFGSSMALVAPQLLFVLTWTAVTSAIGACVLYVRRHVAIERWNADVANLRAVADHQQREIFARLERLERLQKGNK